VLKCCEVFW